MVVFDTSILVLSFNPDNASPPLDPKTGTLLANCKARVDFLINKLNSNEKQILIPTPVLSEYLIKAGPNKGE